VAPPRYITGDRVLGPSPARDMYVARIGSALNPRRIASILTQADTGKTAALHDLLNELRQKDPSLHSLLQTRELALLACGRSIQDYVAPGQDEPDTQAKEIGAFCREFVEGIDGLEAAEAHLLDANVKAFSIAEIEYDRRDIGVVPVALHTVHGRRWEVSDQQRIVFSDGGEFNPPVDVLGQYPLRFVVHTPRVNGDQLAREGLGRCLAWFSCFENWAWRDWLLFAELFGKPWRIVEYDETYQGTDDTEIKAALDSMTASTYGIFPAGAKMRVEWPNATGGSSGSGSPAAALIDKCTAWKSLAVIGQQMTISETTGGLGGKGDARDKVRKDILQADGIALGSRLRWALLAPAVRFKFGAKATPPHWVYDTEDEADIKSFAESIDILADRMDVPVGYVRDKAGIPRPQPGEDVLRASATTATPADQPDAQDTPDSPDAQDSSKA